MKIYDYSNIKKLYVIGDIHGDFEPFFNVIKRGINLNNKEKIINNNDNNILSISLKRPRNIQSDLYNDSVIIVCGDCGFGFNKHQYYIDVLTKQNETYNKTNTHIIFIRGNHDDPSYFNGDIIDMSNIKAIQDYSVIKTAEMNILCVGGAISVDRIWRKQQEVRINKYSKNNFKKLFWENENIIINENILEELRNNDIKISSVVTHTAPSFCMPKTKDSSIGWLKVDPTLNDDLEKERSSMDWLFNELIKEHELKFWTYGHFHIDYSEIVNNVVFIANPDNLCIISPIEKYKYLTIREEINKNNEKKRKKRRNNNVDAEFNNTDIFYDDELLNELENLIYNRDNRTNDNIENNNEGVVEELEETPF